MACFSPVMAWQSRCLNASGKRSLVFHAEHGVPGSFMEIPCGGCIGCRIDYARGWAVRLTHEAYSHSATSFLTLTYDDDHLPGDGSVSVRELQLFMKRLRRLFPGVKLRYFACAEYGETTFRPHYHLILFGADFRADRKVYSGRDSNRLYTSPTLEAAWGKGSALIGSVTPSSTSYVAGYAMKKVTGESADAHYARFNPASGLYNLVLPEFSLSSRRPGIGHDFYQAHKSQIVNQDSIVFKGKLVPVPSYYDRLLEKVDPERLLLIKQARLDTSSTDWRDQSPARLAVRAECAAAKRKLFAKKVLG